jgi:two-component system chemotaxis sensor kinase CheA
MDETAAINSLYRDVHSLKGSAQLFGYSGIGRLSHAMESALEPVRRGAIPLAGRLVDTIYAGLDAIRRHLVSLRADGKESSEELDGEQIVSRLVAITTALLTGSDGIARDDPPLSTKTRPSPSPLPAPVEAKSASRPNGEAGAALSKVQALEPAAPAPAPSPAKEASTDQSSGDSVRVAVGLLDKLMNLTGELVLIRNQVIQITNSQGADSTLLNLSKRLSVVTSELQNEVMKTRMQPIGNVVSKFHRVVRDMARDLGKSVELVLEGTDTELDKTLIEAIKDPLTHIVRNAVDHGLETPEIRRSSGKPVNGSLCVRSFHEGGQVIVEIEDDGRGLARARIGSKAIEKGLITPEALERMSDREVHQLIFAPGFSTADQVTNFSGRGVGMDVVRTNIERIGGLVDLTSVEGKGTTIRLKIPLTLAIIPALIIRSQRERFAIPQVKLVELVRAERDASGAPRGIELLQGRPVYRLRGELLPLVSLGETFGLTAGDDGREDALSIVILNADHGCFGLIVDEIDDSVDIVVKPLPSFLKALSVYSGSTVLGDGSVVLTLDVIGLAGRAGMFAQDTSTGSAVRKHAAVDATHSDVIDYLMVDLGGSSRFALPLCLVKRLEEFKSAVVEQSGSQRVVRYRDAILPLVSLPQKLGIESATASERDTVPVVVVERNNRLFGLEVGRVLDVISTSQSLDSRVSDRPAMLGSMIFNDEVIVVVDLYAAIDQHLGVEPATTTGAGHEDSGRASHRVLVVDDSAFFRRHIERVLSEAGYKISTAVDGKDALALLTSRPSDFALVVSDIEMPNVNGLELARRVRQTERIARLPLVAMSTRFHQTDQEAGTKAGFSRYLEKLNADQLVTTLDALLGIGGT